jgi:hypothetical protein
VPSGIGSAEINETNVMRTKRLAKSAVVISFIEASLSFPVYIDLLDVGGTERLTALDLTGSRTPITVGPTTVTSL